MNDKNSNSKSQNEEIFSKSLRAGRRTYFFDVRETRAGDYYLTITESKKNTNEDGTFFFKKHKIFLYKEDFESFKESLIETTTFITQEKGVEVISDKHQPDYVEKEVVIDCNRNQVDGNNHIIEREPLDKFIDLSFDDI